MALLQLTVRFTTSMPDLSLVFPEPSLSTPLHIKQHIRTQRPENTATRTLRLIYGGRVLGDRYALSDIFERELRQHQQRQKLPPPPKSSSNAAAAVPTGGVINGESDPRDKGKGKAPLRPSTPSTAFSPSHPTIYVHCSIGDEASAETLSAEATALLTFSSSSSISSPSRLQALPPYGRDPSAASSSSSTTRAGAGGTDGRDTSPISPRTPTTTTPAPVGFDRLLSAGLTAVEVSSLRAQFLHLQARTHTPDDMPTAAEMRLLEDRWLDEGTTAGGSFGGAGGTGLDMGFDGGGAAGAAEGYVDLVLGSAIGFFWPVGVLVWGLREEGVWSVRRQMAACAGIGVGVLFSLFRVVG
ncbi:MAG: hypothetical protein M1825_001175 [Sarcosagium campestre]|nr:MAG: hypothetical protein M1825_001175 [Sarcosagium campestre]